MTEPAPEGTPQGGMNPAWNDLLSAIPSDLHNDVLPKLQAYDQSYQSKIQEATKPFEGYKSFVENQISPDQMQVALQLAQAFEQNPQAIYEALAQDFGNPQDPQKQTVEDTEGSTAEEFEGIPKEFVERFQQLQEGYDTIKEILVQQHQMSQQEQEDIEFDKWLKDYAEQDPLFAALNKDGLAEPYINALVMAGHDDPKDIQEAFAKFVDAVAQYHNRPKPPTLLGAGGFMPEGATRPRDMSDTQADKTAVEMLMHAIGQGR